MFRLVMLACVFAAADACDVCVSGVCQQRRDLLVGFAVTDQMAFDHRSRVLYLQLEHSLYTVVDFPDFKIERVQHLNTSGLVVDQTSSSLYTAHNTTLYKYTHNNHSLGIASTDELHAEPDLMFYKDKLYYTKKCCSGLYYIITEDGSCEFNDLVNYKITDFVVNKNDKIYFVSNDKLYVYQPVWTVNPELMANKRYVLSVDKFGDVYLGDVTTNGIYKLDDSDRLVEYAAYAVGSIDRFVFDHENNIVFHDAAGGTVSYWKPEGTPCAIAPPHDKFVITSVSNNVCGQQQYEQSTIAYICIYSIYIYILKY